MIKITSAAQASHKLTKPDADADGVLDHEFKLLTMEEAQAWRQVNPEIKPWRIIVLQVIVGILMVVMTFLFSGNSQLSVSVAWGMVAVVLPSMVFVRALNRQMQCVDARTALVGLFVWELVKVVLTVALLLISPYLISDLNWLALLVSFVVTLKVYGLAIAFGWMQRRSIPFNI